MFGQPVIQKLPDKLHALARPKPQYYLTEEGRKIPTVEGLTWTNNTDKPQLWSKDWASEVDLIAEGRLHTCYYVCCYVVMLLCCVTLHVIHASLVVCYMRSCVAFGCCLQYVLLWYSR